MSVKDRVWGWYVLSEDGPPPFQSVLLRIVSSSTMHNNDAEKKSISKVPSFFQVLVVNRFGRVTFKMYSVTVTNYFIEKVFNNIIQVPQYESNVIWLLLDSFWKKAISEYFYLIMNLKLINKNYSKTYLKPLKSSNFTSRYYSPYIFI